jgi:hypothetical protein
MTMSAISTTTAPTARPVWKLNFTDEGVPYYQNEATQEISWTLPIENKVPVSPRQLKKRVSTDLRKTVIVIGKKKERLVGLKQLQDEEKVQKGKKTSKNLTKSQSWFLSKHRLEKRRSLSEPIEANSDKEESKSETKNSYPILKNISFSMDFANPNTKLKLHRYDLRSSR